MDRSGHLAASSSIKPENGVAIDDESFREYQSNPNIPADAKALAALLRSSGVSDYDPKVINQLLDFMHSMFSAVLGASLLKDERNRRIKTDQLCFLLFCPYHRIPY